jgi:hypothetical protein
MGKIKNRLAPVPFFPFTHIFQPHNIPQIAFVMSEVILPSSGGTSDEQVLRRAWTCAKCQTRNSADKAKCSNKECDQVDEHNREAVRQRQKLRNIAKGKEMVNAEQRARNATPEGKAKKHDDSIQLRAAARVARIALKERLGAMSRTPGYCDDVSICHVPAQLCQIHHLDPKNKGNGVQGHHHGGNFGHMQRKSHIDSEVENNTITHLNGRKEIRLQLLCAEHHSTTTKNAASSDAGKASRRQSCRRRREDCNWSVSGKELLTS